MTSYKDSGVNVETGDKASKNAYMHAASTFASRKGMIGEPVFEEGGFAGLLDMGEFYLIQTDDGTGTKIDVASEMGKYETLGYDLLAMVVDDAICTGAEVIGVSNCIDVPKVDPKMIDSLLKGLAKACSEQKIVIPAGEIAEVPGAVNRGVWSATAVGILEKSKLLKPATIRVDDTIIALRETVARSNGFSLIRKILSDAFGAKWHSEEWRNGVTWGEIMLTPSIIYHSAILELTGRYKQERKVDVKAVAHITGGGIPSKFRRALKATGLGAELTDLWAPHDAMKDLIALWNVTLEEAYRTVNMGNGMLIVVSPEDAQKAMDLLKKSSVSAKIAGKITKDPSLIVETYADERLEF